MKKGERRGGRAKGTPNTVTRILKEGIILAGENIGNRLSLGHLDIVLLQRLKFEHGITTLDGKATLAQRLLHFLNGLLTDVIKPANSVTRPRPADQRRGRRK